MVTLAKGGPTASLGSLGLGSALSALFGSGGKTPTGLGPGLLPLSVTSPTRNMDFSIGPSGGVTSTLTRTPLGQQPFTQLTGIDQALMNEFSRVTPGFGAITDARVKSVRDAATVARGNLRDQLARRRVLGSSFGEDAISRQEAEFAKVEAEERAKSFLEELDMRTRILDQRTKLNEQRVVSELDELGLPTSIINTLTTAIAEANKIDKENALLALQSEGEFFGEAGGLIEDLLFGDRGAGETIFGHGGLLGGGGGGGGLLQGAGGFLKDLLGGGGGGLGTGFGGTASLASTLPFLFDLGGAGIGSTFAGIGGAGAAATGGGALGGFTFGSGGAGSLISGAVGNTTLAGGAGGGLGGLGGAGGLAGAALPVAGALAAAFGAYMLGKLIMGKQDPAQEGKVRFEFDPDKGFVGTGSLGGSRTFSAGILQEMVNPVGQSITALAQDGAINVDYTKLKGDIEYKNGKVLFGGTAVKSPAHLLALYLDANAGDGGAITVKDAAKIRLVLEQASKASFGQGPLEVEVTRRHTSNPDFLGRRLGGRGR